jgi:hypothetical protein
MHQANSIMDANPAGYHALAAQWLEGAGLATALSAAASLAA